MNKAKLEERFLTVDGQKQLCPYDKEDGRCGLWCPKCRIIERFSRFKHRPLGTFIETCGHSYEVEDENNTTG